MVENKRVPTGEELPIIKAAVEVYREQGADWLAATALRDAMDVEVNLAQLIRLMGQFGQKPDSREYEGRSSRGFTIGQFSRLMQTHEENVREVSQQQHGHDLNECAKHLLDYIRSLDVDWGLLIGILQEIRGFDDKLTVVALMSYALENRVHMEVPAREFFLSQPTWSPEEHLCEICGDPYKMSYPGQPPICLNSECGRTYHQTRPFGSNSTRDREDTILEEDGEGPTYVDPALIAD